jgi:hypothetical protein
MEDGKTFQLPYNAEREQEIVRITNEASLLAIAVGCEQLFEGQTSLPATEYVIFEPLPESTIEIRSVNYFESNLN